MPIVHIVPYAHPEAIDIPGEGEKERSVVGAIHFKPGTIREITDHELGWLQKHRPDYVKYIRVAVLPKSRPQQKIESNKINKFESDVPDLGASSEKSKSKKGK